MLKSVSVLLPLLPSLASASSGTGSASEEVRFRFLSNANYRLTAVLDVNGGASSSGHTGNGISIPIDVVTIASPSKPDEYVQRIGYYGDLEVDWNVNGKQYKIVHRDGGEEKVCYDMSDDDEDGDSSKAGYLNFFPTEQEFKRYSDAQVVTAEPGVPYQITTLTVAHGGISDYDQPKLQEEEDRDRHLSQLEGMPNDDSYEFHYEILDSVSRRPMLWRMLARNEVFNAHTENWVLRYVSYDPMETEEVQAAWKQVLDSTFPVECADGSDSLRTKKSMVGGGRTAHHGSRVSMLFSASSSARPRDETTLTAEHLEFDEAFEHFLLRHGKSYPDLNEKRRRNDIHNKNVETIARLNEAHAGQATFEPNRFLDMTVEEVLRFRGGHVPSSHSSASEQTQKEATTLLRGSTEDEIDVEEGSFTTYEVPSDFDPSSLPDSFDWRTEMPGSVGPIKDQGVCGSCWAFSLISALESHWYIHQGETVTLPEQFVVDCTWSKYNGACDGGLSAYGARELLTKYGGSVPLQDQYGAYLSVDGRCYVDSLGLNLGGGGSGATKTPSIRFDDWVQIESRDQVAVQHALFKRGPLSIAFNVVEAAIYYASGVIDVEECQKHGGKYLDHAINLVGWETDEKTGQKHWIMRNSWSTLWGDDGYFRVVMGERDCGVTTDAGFPLVQNAAKEEEKAALFGAPHATPKIEA